MPIRAPSRSPSRRRPGRRSIYVPPPRRVDTHGYLNFTFCVHGGTTGGQTIQVVAVVNDAPQPGVRVASPAAGTWQKITVPLAALGADEPHRREWLLDPAGLGRR